MAKILNYWNNLLRVVLSLLSPEHIKIKIKKKKCYSSSRAAEIIINQVNTFNLLYFKEVRLDDWDVCEFKSQILKSRSILDI